MADRIKGIIVEIGGDTKGLDEALSGISSTSRDLQKELRDVQKLLKFDPNNAELLAQRQRLLNDQIENTTTKLQHLKDAQASVEAQFQAGTLGADQYRAFQRELADTESYLRNTQNALQDLEEEQQNIQKSTQEMNRFFEVTGGSLEEFADIIGTRTVRAIQQGTASSRDLQRAFDQIAQASLGASTDVGQVREALQRLESGEASIRGVRRQLQNLSEDAQDSRDNVKDLGGELGGLVAGAGAGMGIGAILEKAMDLYNVDTTIELTMEIPEESQQAVKNAISTVGSYIGDNEAALEGVRKQFQLNADLTDEQNQKIVQGAGLITRAYSEVDFTELIQESYEMANSMNMTQEEALGMTKTLLDMGFPPEQLDIITEYGSQLSRAGYTAEEIQGIFASGIETGSWNIDNLMDGLKEGRIVLAEFGQGVPKAIAESLKGTDISAKQVQAWGQSMSEGGEKGKQAMMDVAIALAGVKDETKRNELGVKFFGTLWEEQGSKITDTIIGAKDNVGDLSANQKALNEDIQKLDASPQQRLNDAISDLWTTLQPVMVTVAEFVGKIADWVAKNPELAGTIVAIVSVLGILMGIFIAIAPIVTAIVGLMGAFSLTMGAIVAPVLIVIGIIAALIAIGVLLWKNWDEISAGWVKGVDKINKSIEKWAEGVKKRFNESIQSAKDMVARIMEAFENWKKGVRERFDKGIQDVKDLWNGLVKWFQGIDLKQIGKDIIQGLINGISSMASKVKESARNIANGIGEKIKSILKLGSPSKLMESYGEFTGEGLAIGLENSLGLIKEMAVKMSKNAIPDIEMNASVSKGNPAPPTGKTMTVNIHSPKALDIREASREFNRTLNKMSLMW